MSALTEGQLAPDFTLPATGGENLTLSDYRGRQSVVLYFYPRDMTSGCTREAVSFRDLQAEFAAAGAAIWGVSTDTLQSHDKFVAKHDLTFPLLSDEEAKVAQLYGVWKEKNLYGRKSMGIVRSTMVIDKQGVIRRIWPKVKVDGHADEVLEVVRGLS